MNEGGSLGLTVCLLNQCGFPLGTRELNRECSVPALALPLWHSLIGPCWTDGHCLAWESIQGYSQAVLLRSFELISALSWPLPKQPPLHLLAVSHFLPALFVIQLLWFAIKNTASWKCFPKLLIVVAKFPNVIASATVKSMKINLKHEFWPQSFLKCD